jgi:hypothetical protein
VVLPIAKGAMNIGGAVRIYPMKLLSNTPCFSIPTVLLAIASLISAIIVQGGAVSVREPSAQIGSIREWYDWIGLEKDIRQSIALYWLGLRDVGILFSRAVIQRPIDVSPAFLEHCSAEKIAL